MQARIIPTVALAILLQTLAGGAQAEDAKTPYPAMAPLDQYLMDANAEIALARSAAPASVSGAAEVLVMGRLGYKTAVKGSNGFVCMVMRSWTAGRGERDFWNPKLRGPACFNAAAVRTFLPIVIRKTELVLAGKSQDQMFADVESALDSKELPPIEAGSMCYMMSKQGYLNDSAGHWHPHLMFFVSHAKPEDWGANLPGSPMLASDDPEDRLVVFMQPVDDWSDGTPGPKM
jgi:hypothetical protein